MNAKTQKTRHTTNQLEFGLIVFILQALAKTLTVSQLSYLRDQFGLLGPNKSGFISIQNLKTVSNFLPSYMHVCEKCIFICVFTWVNLRQAFLKSSTETMKDSGVLDFVNMVCLRILVHNCYFLIWLLWNKLSKKIIRSDDGFVGEFSPLQKVRFRRICRLGN